MVINPATGHVPPQVHMMFDDEFPTFSFIMEVTIPPNWTDLLQPRSQRGAPDNINFRDTWFTQDLEGDPSKTPSHVPRIPPDNNINTIPSKQPVRQVQENTVNEGASVSEVIKIPYSEGV